MEQERPGSVQRIPLSQHSPYTQQGDLKRATDHHRVSRLLEPNDLILRAYEAMNLGILVVSHDGFISHYNSMYAQLRHIPPDSMIGHPVAELDRNRYSSARQIDRL
jgi:hypothetical protein